MKTHILFTLILVSLMGTSFPETDSYSPILMHRDDLEKSIKSIDPVVMKNPGKIYIKGDILYIVERFKGIHVINDSDPTNPVMVKFIVVPGIVDLSIKNNLLYCDNAVDLVSVDITNPSDIKTVSRIRNVFPELVHPLHRNIPWKFSRSNRPANTIIVNWKKIEP